MIYGIVAHDDDFLIGEDNQIPWHLPADLKYFMSQTKGNTVVMGRNTWDSLPFKPLKNRKNIVVSSTMNSDSVLVVSSVEEAIGASDGDVYVIGGSRLYKESAVLFDALLVTRISGSYYSGVGGVHIFDYTKDFVLSHSSKHETYDYRIRSKTTPDTPIQYEFQCWVPKRSI